MIRYDMLDDLSLEARSRHDLIIDARSPSEFAEDHIPGAVNLPVLSDAERAEIGTIYTRVSPFEARRKGAALVARNVAAHLEGGLSDRPREFRPLVYCWRGGMRSNSFATILSAVGWRTCVVDGGYKAWRRTARLGTERISPALSLIMIDGQTGSGKTALLHVLADEGEQMIDLEGLANHRGSAFGALGKDLQPSQKGFETRLWSQLETLDPARPVFIEAESALVGQRRIPAALWTAMKAAPRIEVRACASARARHTLERYPDMTADPTRIEAALDHLVGLHAKETVEDWRILARSGNYAAFAERLIVEHYDPAYIRARKREAPSAKTIVEAQSLDDEGLKHLASTVRAAAASL